MWVMTALVALLPLAAGRSAPRPRGSVDGDPRAYAYPYQPAEPYFEAAMPPCPRLPPAEVDLDQLLGGWHLSLLLLADRAGGDDGLLDESLCAAVDVTRTNGTMLRLDWHLQRLGLPAGLADLRLQVSAAILGPPGLWALATPLGGEMVGTVAHAAPGSHFVLAVCGDRQFAGRRSGGSAAPSSGGEEAVHVLTALLTRRPPSALGSLELLRLSALVMPGADAGDAGDAGAGLRVRRVGERLLSWGQC